MIPPRTAKQRYEHVASFDIGSTFCSTTVASDGRIGPVKFPVDGAQVSSAVLIDGATHHFGSEAYLRAWKNPSQLFTHFKTSLCKAPDESFHGGPTPVELTGLLIGYLVKQLLVKRPELQDYPQFAGTKCSAEDLCLAFTIPASWGIAEQDAMRRAIKLAGVNVDAAPIAFLYEPRVGCRRVAHEFGRRLRPGDKIMDLDFGGGTFDMIGMQFPDWHEISPPAGDAFLGGQQFTAALALLLCERLKLTCTGAFSIEQGMNLAALPEETDRETALNVWPAAEDLKIKLSTTDRVSVFVQTPSGKREVVVTLDEAQHAWQPLWERLERVVGEALRDAGLDWKHIDHVFLIGGGALTASFRTRIAKLTGRAESDVLVSEESAYVVSSGAAEEAYFGGQVDTCLRGGLGMRMQDRDGRRKNYVYLRPNHNVPAGGQHVERLGQSIRSRGERGVLMLEPFMAKPGIRCADPLLGQTVTLDDREIIPLREVNVDLNWPQGDHEVRLGVSIDPNGTTNLVISPVALPDIEPFNVPLMLDDGAARPQSSSKLHLEIALIVDCSNSMRGAKLKAAQAATARFIRDVARYGVDVCLIAMGGPQPCSLVSPFGNDIEACLRSLDALTTSGGTHMAEAEALADQVLSNGNPACQKMAVLFSDGRPHCLATALSQATRLKSIARLLCVGIGPDADEMLLTTMASSERDYFTAQTPDDIFTVLFNIAELIHTAADGHETFCVPGH